MSRAAMLAATPLPAVASDFSPFGVTFLPPFGEATLVSPDLPVRDTDIYAEIVRLLVATGDFGQVAYPDPVEIDGKGADLKSLAIVLPGTGDESQGWADPTEDVVVRKMAWTLEIRVRHSRPSIRDELASRLLNVAHATLDYQSLLGATISEFTRFKGDRPVAAAPPERRVQLMGEFSYFVRGSRRSTDL